MRTALDIVVPYPGSMAQGIDDWLGAATESGHRVDVLSRENGTGQDGLAVVAVENAHGYRVTAWTCIRYHYRFTAAGDVVRVEEPRQDTRTGGWNHHRIWEGPSGRMPLRYAEDADRPWKVGLFTLDDDHELYVLHTPDRGSRATMVTEGGEGYAAWRLGALRLDDYTMEFRHPLTGRRIGRNTPGRELAAEVRYWEAVDRERRPYLHS